MSDKLRTFIYTDMDQLLANMNKLASSLAKEPGQEETSRQLADAALRLSITWTTLCQAAAEQTVSSRLN